MLFSSKFQILRFISVRSLILILVNKNKFESNWTIWFHLSVIRFNSQKKNFLIWNIDCIVEQILILNKESLLTMFGYFRISYIVCINIHCYNLSTVVSPRAKLHNTRLLIKREILHVNLTGWLVNSRRFPVYFASKFQSGLRH